jgi:integrase
MAQARLKSVPGWPYLDGVRLCDINSDHVRRLITAAGTAEYSSQSVRHIKNVFFAVISHAQREGCFNGPNPASLVKLPKIVRRDQHNLTFEQTKSILQILPSPLKEIALFAITTGMSLVEICRLQWKHVNLSDAERVVDGEPIPARTLAVRASGSSRSVCKSRNLEIHEPLFSTLKQLSPQNRNFKGNSLVIVSHEGEPILPSGVQAALSRQVAKASGLPWLTWQVLRRARSSFFAEFLSQLSAPSLSGDARISVRESNTLETRSDQRLCERASALDSCRRRTFCFGDRKQVPGEALRRWTRWTPTPEFAEDLVRG